MAQHKSAEKRNKQSIQRTERNTAIRSRMRRALRKARAAVAAKAPDKDALVKKAVVEVNRAASRNVMKANTASRYVSRLMRAANAS